jgi:Permuted papain-like amidase enzyme, YaeF/YiiX, C92 family
MGQAPLTAENLAAMRAEGEKEMGRPYDIRFNMDDERIYCSELVWKIYERGAHLRVGTIERFGDMDFTGAEARRVLKERFGNAFPADQEVITPASIFRSHLLSTVDSLSAPPPIP